ncbi:MAG TPA: glucose/galactose MFS transporter [Bacteroidetes bacterium]|nr:MAG: sugar MFS transporter [Rhodothermaeota bacterium MED-G64]HBW00333.1 glucose/galactose MFS transporter [Bacteroidota bacterium]
MSNPSGKTYPIALIVVTSLFFMWGFITVLVDALIPRLKEIFELTYFQAGLIQFSFFTAYFVFSIPGGGLISRIGYKRGVVVGLLTMAVGCLLFIPAAGLRVFPIFLLAMFVLAAGITLLQVAANPYVNTLGPEESAASRLNLSQAFNSLGTTIAPLIGAAYLLGDVVASPEEVASMTEAAKQAYVQAEAMAVRQPFTVIAGVLALLAGVFALFKLPRILDDGQEGMSGYLDTFRTPHVMYGALAIFVYVGAEVSIGSYLVNYFLELDVQSIVDANGWMGSLASTLSGSDPSSIPAARLAGTFVVFYWGGAMVGRFIGSALQLFIRPGTLLAVYSLVNVTLLGVTILTTGAVSMWTVLSIGLFNSIMFPTIFSLGIAKLGNRTAQGSGILCTAIVGGALIPPLYGWVADLSGGLALAFVVPALCYIYIAWYGAKGSSVKPALATG